MIVSSSFSVFFISPDQVGERLSVSVTILLTFTAFQNIIAELLPQTSENLLIDWYIGFAYLLQVLLVLGSCLTSLNDDLSINVIKTIDQLFAIILGILWVSFSFFYVSMRWRTFTKLYDKICCDCCCLGRINYNNWERRGVQEETNWLRNARKITGFDPKNIKINTCKKRK